MENQHSEIYSIIARFMVKHPDPLSPEEQAVLNEWLQEKEGQNRKIFTELTNDDEFLKALELFYRFKTEDGQSDKWRIKYQELINNKSDEVPLVRSVRFGAWKKYAVAASLILAISLSVLLYETKRNKPQVTETPALVKNDIPPGQFKAKLTLADGSTVNLDSAAQGTLVSQGTTTVLNKKGQLIYKKGKLHNEVLYNTLTTDKGQTYVTQLSDGTKVWLNSQSSIRYPVAFDGDTRRVEITGEAYFEVAHNKSKPFYINAGGMNVQVLGTHFNINAYNDESDIKTTLLEGKVKVTNGNSETILAPGQQAQLNTQTEKLSMINGVDIDQVVAWRNGYFQFHHTDLKAVLRQLVRWYDVEVSFEGKVPEMTFGGKIPRNSNLSNVLEVLQTSEVSFKIQGKKIIVSP